MRIRPFALLATLLLPLSLAAETYTYTGNDFTSVVNSGTTPVFTTSDFVTIAFTTAAPLPDNIGSGNLVPVVPLSWSFSDGVQADNSADTNADTEFYLATNATGQIVGWAISDELDFVPYPYLENTIIESAYDPSTGASYNFANDSEGDYGSNSYLLLGIPPGSWSLTPETPPFTLLLLGGACLCGVGYLRSRKRPASLTV